MLQVNVNTSDVVNGGIAIVAMQVAGIAAAMAHSGLRTRINAAIDRAIARRMEEAEAAEAAKREEVK